MPFPLSSIFLLLVFSFASPGGVVADDDNYRFSIAQSLDTFGSRVMSAWSGGGGAIWNLEDTKGYPFAGRPYGSGDRHTIYGSRAYGSGYPQWNYRVSNPESVTGRGFPYGAWPIPWAGNYAGGGEYGAASVDILRPGGRMVQVPLKSGTSHWNISSEDEETYWLIGDRDSTVSTMASMVVWCHAQPIWPEAFDSAEDAVGVAGNATGQGVKFHPGNVLQYYRASTFALAHPEYNNTYAHHPLNTSTQLTHDQSTPLSDIVSYSPWLHCINETISKALPILDAPPPQPGLPKIAIFFIILAGLLALMFMTYLLFAIRNWEKTKIRQIQQKKRAERNQRLHIEEFQYYP
jgi:hypothetical protein